MQHGITNVAMQSHYYGFSQLKIASSLRSPWLLLRSLRRLLLALCGLHGPGQPLNRFPVSPSPCSRRNDDLTGGSLNTILQENS